MLQINQAIKPFENVEAYSPGRRLLPLPLAGEVDALARARRVGETLSTRHLLLSWHPHPSPHMR
jgi:hypothetical protein